MKKYNWVAQDWDGLIVISVNKPTSVSQVLQWAYESPEFKPISQGCLNSNWKESLIDLNKNDYIIKDGILMQQRKHAALIHAWADGAEIQYRDSLSGRWFDITTNKPYWEESIEYRVKPKTTTVKFKNYIHNGRIIVHVQGDAIRDPHTTHWIDKEWREVEVEL